MPTIADFLRTPRRSDAELEEDLAEVRRTAARVDGQHASDRSIVEHRERTMMQESIAFADELRRQLPESSSDDPSERQAAYFAAALLLLNLRAGFPVNDGGAAACDELGRQAAAWFVAQGRELPRRPEGLRPAPEDVTSRGAELAQRLLEKFPILVSDHGVDRRQGCFAAALLTVRLRAGEVNLFVPAADAANLYITTNWEKA